MSAYVVSDETLGRIIAFLREPRFSQQAHGLLKGYDTWIETSRRELASAMHVMNVEAVCERYADEKPSNYPFVLKIMPSPTRVQFVCSLSCYLYQCSEGDVPKCELYKALAQCRYAVALDIVRDMPEYERAIGD